jgi:hypothetical protein
MRKTLTKGEESLVEETKAKNLEPLDEDALLELHRRVRRARNKYVKAYRRESVGAKKSRWAVKAEAFEDALSLVSQRLGVIARQSAAELRAERLAAAKGSGASSPSAPDGSGDRVVPVPDAPSRSGDRTLVSPASRKRNAATRASGARRQAKRDSR